MTVSEIYKAHVEYLEAMAAQGDEVSIRSLAGMALLIAGWRYGDPDPVDGGPDGDGGLPLDDDVVVLFRRAA